MSLIHLVLLILAIAGTPLFIIISGYALFSFASRGIDPSVVIIEMTRLAETPLLLSLPLFIFAGMLLSESKAPMRILALSRSLLGWLPGGLAVVSLGVCAVFTAFTGASGVTIFALGGLLMPALLKDRYSESFSLGLITTSGSLGLLFPPSLPIILYGVISGSRIDQMFLAGLLPGLLMLGVLTVYTVLKNPQQRSVEKATGVPLLACIRQCIWEIPLPFVILGGIYGGIFTPAEAAAVAALYVLVVEVFLYRDIPLTELPMIMANSMVLFGGIFIIIAASMASTNFLIDQQVPEYLFSILQEYITSKYTFLLLLNIFLLLVGAMLDIFSAIVLVVPLVLPVATAYGIDPVHLGVVFLTNLQIGYCTPPVGLNLFLASYRFDKPVVEIYTACLPFLVLLLLILLAVTYFPPLSLSLVETLL